MKRESIVLAATNAEVAIEQEVLQNLWSGYGSIVRYALKGAAQESVIVKHASPPTACNHPRGWDTDLSHERKLKSYVVEMAWYREYASRCGVACRVPQCLGLETDGDEFVMVLEDLDAAGYPARRTDVNETEIELCLHWLANFHAEFLHEKPSGLWEVGTYWHLETRPNELAVLQAEDPALYAAAENLDATLNRARFQTLVHGDAKLANFCFSEDSRSVAAVDFQYVGGGCGMKDVAYFIGSCLREEECERMEGALLDVYFGELRKALNGTTGADGSLGRTNSTDLDALETEWRGLFPVAWADFHRFLKGWSPGHWKINSYSERVTRSVIENI